MNLPLSFLGCKELQGTERNLPQKRGDMIYLGIYDPFGVKPHTSPRYKKRKRWARGKGWKDCQKPFMDVQQKTCRKRGGN
jgi:hypothetical protein